MEAKSVLKNRQTCRNFSDTQISDKDDFFPVVMMAVGNSATPFKDREFVKDKISTVYID